MEMTIPEDCGNSPRMALVAEIVRAWAAGEEDAVRGWLRDDVSWLLVGEDAPSEGASSEDAPSEGASGAGVPSEGASGEGVPSEGASGVGASSEDAPGEGAPAERAYVRPPLVAEQGEILTVLNHGRLAACDGYLLRGGERVDFCHVLRFAGATKTARIREIRTYLQGPRTVR